MSGLDGWVHLTHPETLGETLVPAAPDVVEAFEARGWVVSDEVPEKYDPDALNRGAVPAAVPVELGEPEVDPMVAAERLIAARDAAAALDDVPPPEAAAVEHDVPDTPPAVPPAGEEPPAGAADQTNGD